MLGIRQFDLEAAADVTKTTIADVERLATKPQPETLDGLCGALAHDDIEFTLQTCGGAGVRLIWSP